MQFSVFNAIYWTFQYDVPGLNSGMPGRAGGGTKGMLNGSMGPGAECVQGVFVGDGAGNGGDRLWGRDVLAAFVLAKAAFAVDELPLPAVPAILEAVGTKHESSLGRGGR